MPTKAPPRRPTPDVQPDSLPKHRPGPDVQPDSLPQQDAPDLLPDDLRRRDPGAEPPDSLPPRDSDLMRETMPDGGVAQHPIHDEDQEDRTPADYEAEIDAVEEVEQDRLSEDAEYPASFREHPEGSAPPLDRRTQDEG